MSTLTASETRRRTRRRGRARGVLAVTGLIGLLGSMVAGIAWAVGPTATDWSQFCNGGNTQCTGGGWRNGDLNKNNSLYVEGDSVPHRLLIDLNGTTAPFTVTFTYATSKGNHVAYDYLTSWDHSESGLLTPADRPIPGVAFSDSATIPLDPGTAASPWFTQANALADGQRQLQVQNATVTTLPVVTADLVDFPTSTDSESTMTVGVTPDPGATQVGIVFASHISSRIDWTGEDDDPLSPFGGGGTAGDITGSPYHVDVVMQGGGDHPLKSNAVVPFTSITVAKQLAAGQSSTVSPGDTVTYELVATNAGNAAGTVDITDTLSGAGAAIAGITSMEVASSDCTAGSLTPGDDTGTCSDVTVPANSSITVTVTVAVDTIQTGEYCDDLTLTNTLTASPDGSTGDDEVDVTIDVPTCTASITASKTVVSPADKDIAVGTDVGVVVYEVEITNSGYAAATGVSVSDLVADNPDFDTLTLHATEADANADTGALANPLSVTVPAKTFGGADGSTSVWVRGEVDLPAAGETCAGYDLDNTATVDLTEQDADTVTVTPVACDDDLSASKVVVVPADGDLAVGTDAGVVVYEVQITNSGYAAATGVSVSDLVADNPDFEAVTLHESQADAVADTGALANPVTVTVPAKTFGGADGSTSVWVRGEVDLPEEGEVCAEYDLDNTATVDGSDYPADAVTVTPITCVDDLSASKVVVVPADGDLAVGTDAGVVVYEVQITNSGYAAATGVSVSDLVADNPDFEAVTLHESQADAVADTGALANPVTVTVPAKTFGGADGSTSVWVRGEVDLPEEGEVCAEYDLDNTATVDGSDYPADAVTVTPITCVDDLSASKVVVVPADGDLAVGTDAGVVVYEVQITNSGYAAATGVSVSDLVADNPDFEAVTLHESQADAVADTGALANPVTVTVPAKTFGGADGSTSVWVRGEVDLPETGETCEAYDLDNTATVDGDDADAEAVTVTPVDCDPEVEIQKYIQAPNGEWLDADEPGSGPTFTLPATAAYRVDVENTGNVDLFHLTLVDQLDPEIVQEVIVDADRSLDILETCLQDVGTEAEAPFDGVLEVGAAISCFFEEPAQVGAHFDVVELAACFPDVICHEQDSPQDELEIIEQPGGFNRTAGGPTLVTTTRRSNAVVASALPPIDPVRLVGSDPAHYTGVLRPPPPPPSVDDPSIDLVKQGSTSSVGVGGTVQYVYTVTNNGDVTLTNVTLTDLVTAGSGNQTIALASGVTLAPGASTTFTSAFTTTEADLGQVVNTATATGTAGTDQVSDVDDWTVTVSGAPGLSLDKSADSALVNFNASSAVDTVITYTYVVTNTGNVTVSGLVLQDDVLGTVSLPATTLAPGEQVTGTATHTVTQADALAGSVVNVAVVTGTDPTGAAVEAQDTEEVGVAEVLGEVVERPDDPAPAPAPEPEPEVAPEVLTATGTDGAATLALGLLLLTLGMVVLEARRAVPGRRLV